MLRLCRGFTRTQVFASPRWNESLASAAGGDVPAGESVLRDMISAMAKGKPPRGSDAAKAVAAVDSVAALPLALKVLRGVQGLCKEDASQCERRNGPSSHLSSVFLRSAVRSGSVPLETVVRRIVGGGGSAGLRATGGALGHVAEASVNSQDSTPELCLLALEKCAMWGAWNPVLDFEWSAAAAARHQGDEALRERAISAARRLLGDNLDAVPASPNVRTSQGLAAALPDLSIALFAGGMNAEAEAANAAARALASNSGAEPRGDLLCAISVISGEGFDAALASAARDISDNAGLIATLHGKSRRSFAWSAVAAAVPHGSPESRDALGKAYASVQDANGGLHIVKTAIDAAAERDSAEEPAAEAE